MTRRRRGLFSPKQTLNLKKRAATYGQERSFEGWCLNDAEVPEADLGMLLYTEAQG